MKPSNFQINSNFIKVWHHKMTWQNTPILFSSLFSSPFPMLLTSGFQAQVTLTQVRVHLSDLRPQCRKILYILIKSWLYLQFLINLTWLHWPNTRLELLTLVHPTNLASMGGRWLTIISQWGSAPESMPHLCWRSYRLKTVWYIWHTPSRGRVNMME